MLHESAQFAEIAEPVAAHPLGGDPPDARGLLDAVPVRLVVLVVVGVVLALRHGCSAAGRDSGDYDGALQTIWSPPPLVFAGEV